MKTAGRLRLIILFAALALNGCQSPPAAPDMTVQGHHGSGATAAKPAFERDMDVSMGKMMADMHSFGYSGDADADFLAMMIPHHQGAVDMARLVLVHGRDPTTRMLAEEIIAGQTVEIESMQRRLAVLRRRDSASADKEFPTLGGTRGQ